MSALEMFILLTCSLMRVKKFMEGINNKENEQEKIKENLLKGLREIITEPVWTGEGLTVNGEGPYHNLNEINLDSLLSKLTKGEEVIIKFSFTPEEDGSNSVYEIESLLKNNNTIEVWHYDLDLAGSNSLKPGGTSSSIDLDTGIVIDTEGKEKESNDSPDSLGQVKTAAEYMPNVYREKKE